VKAAGDDAEAGKQEALAAEATCLVDRRALAEQANDVSAARRAAVEAAYGRALARTYASEKGGARLRAPEVAAMDSEAFEGDVAAVLAGLTAAASTVEATARCRAFPAVLEKDLPAFVLVAHPDPAQTCPTNYLAVLGATSLRGRWGLSDRAAEELRFAARTGVDEGTPEEGGFDPRDVDRMSAAMVAAGVRAVRSELLDVDLGERVVAAPSEVNLWALALFEAGLTMPPVSPGSAPGTIATCVADLLRARQSADSAAAPGEPVLPPVWAVVSGKESVVPTPTPSCAWPEDAVTKGARVALRAVTLTAAVPPESPSKE